MFCVNCGSEVPEGAKFCPNCGTDVAGKHPVPTPSGAEPAPAVAQGSANETTAAPSPEQTPVSAPAPEMANTTPVSPASAPAPAPNAQPVSTQPPANEPWYGKTWVIILFLIFLWPVGLVFMWLKSCKWQKVAKIIISVFFGLVVIGEIVTFTSCIAAKTTGPIVNIEIGSSNAISSASSASGKQSANASSSASSSGKATSSSSKSSSSSKQSAPSSAPEITNGAPNICGIAGSDGEELADLCYACGIDWSNSDIAFTGKTTSGNNYMLFAMDSRGGRLDRSEFLDLPYQYYTDTPVAYGIMVDGYSSISDMMKALLQNSQADASAVNADETAAMYLVWPGGGDNIVVDAHLNKNTGVAYVYLLNSAYIASGGANSTFGADVSGMKASKAFDVFAQKAQGQGWRVAG